MIEKARKAYENVDSKFRDPNGGWADACKIISPKIGEPYLCSWQKRTVDVVGGAVLAAAATPVIAGLAVVKHAEDGDGAYCTR